MSLVPAAPPHLPAAKALKCMLLAAALVAAAPAIGEFAGMEVHRDWASLIVYDKDNVRFRSLTQYTAGGEYVALVLDRVSGECSTQYATINLVMDFPAPATRSTEDMVGLFRVDKAAPRKMVYSITYKKGDLIAYAVVKSFEQERDLLQNLREGGQIRIGLTAREGPLELRFSLAGFTAAMERTLSLCLASQEDRTEAPQRPAVF
jgi:hypothetical protein